MSNIDNDAVIPTEIIEGEVVESVETKSFLKKLNPVPHIKKHPKIATAVGLGVALVAGAALFGGDPVSETPDYTPEDLEEETEFEPVETVTPDEI